MNTTSTMTPTAPGVGARGLGGSTADHSLDIRPLITRHRLRRRRRRTAATLLTGASIALGAAAVRSPGASAHVPVAASVTGTTPPAVSGAQPPPGADAVSVGAPAVSIYG